MSRVFDPKFKRPWNGGSGSFDSIKNIIDSFSVFFHHIDIADEHVRYILVEYIGNILFWCEMEFTTGIPPVDSDQEEYDDDYKDRAGTKDYFRKSWIYTATKDDTTPITTIKLTEPDDTDCETFLFKGTIKVDENAVFGDYFQFKVVDKDGLYYPAGTILKSFVDPEYMVGGQQIISIQPPSTDQFGAKKRLPPGVYLYGYYTSIGTINDVNVIIGTEYLY